MVKKSASFISYDEKMCVIEKYEVRVLGESLIGRIRFIVWGCASVICTDSSLRIAIGKRNICGVQTRGKLIFCYNLALLNVLI